ncbi:TIGR03745 family integrating conjugative element membrane protein, partial [Salmonella enterica subsp. enterica]|nr:TIGR03745 family integrating conjugative element membrane protein [Salmonella enterica subsp. enterica serovar Ona]
VLAAAAMLVVGNAIIATFSEVRDGKSSWGKFGMLVVVGVVLIVVVIWLAAKAATVLLG